MACLIIRLFPGPRKDSGRLELPGQLPPWGRFCVAVWAVRDAEERDWAGPVAGTSQVAFLLLGAVEHLVDGAVDPRPLPLRPEASIHDEPLVDAHLDVAPIASAAVEARKRIARHVDQVRD